uniref:Transposase n=1 Tax=Panagrellus redivivus TaxID=6233 RepID=A0A7E4V2U6_PANRE
MFDAWRRTATGKAEPSPTACGCSLLLLQHHHHLALSYVLRCCKGWFSLLAKQQQNQRGCLQRGRRFVISVRPRGKARAMNCLPKRGRSQSSIHLAQQMIVIWEKGIIMPWIVDVDEEGVDDYPATRRSFELPFPK